MRLIILAAGKGERLLPLTRNTPKPLLDLGDGRTLLEAQIDSAGASGAVDEVVLVTGYLADQIDAKLRRYLRQGLAVRTIYNPFYEVSNNLMSLWLARAEMDRDFLVTNGDNLFTAEVFRGLCADTADGIHLAIGRKDAFDYDDMKVQIEWGLVKRVSKAVAEADAQAESPGLALVHGGRARCLFLDQLESLGRRREHLASFWLEVFNALYACGVPVLPWWFDATSSWQEVDVHVDVRRLKERWAQATLEPAAAGMPRA